MKKTLTWGSLLRRGPFWAHLAAIPRAEAEEFSRSLSSKKQVAVRIIRGKECATKDALLAEFARALGFPSYFGHNWDALEDCLTDLEWLGGDSFVFIIVDGDAVLRGDEKGFATCMEILSASASYWEKTDTTTFHVVFQCERAFADHMKARLSRAGAAIR